MNQCFVHSQRGETCLERGHWEESIGMICDWIRKRFGPGNLCLRMLFSRLKKKHLNEK